MDSWSIRAVTEWSIFWVMKIGIEDVQYFKVIMWRWIKWKWVFTSWFEVSGRSFTSKVVSWLHDGHASCCHIANHCLDKLNWITGRNQCIFWVFISILSANTHVYCIFLHFSTFIFFQMYLIFVVFFVFEFLCLCLKCVLFCFIFPCCELSRMSDSLEF
jgi:hypothetical protein